MDLGLTAKVAHTALTPALSEVPAWYRMHRPLRPERARTGTAGTMGTIVIVVALFPFPWWW
jgi:hypothetical protein